MLIKTLDGHEKKWKLDSAAAGKKSGPHLQVQELLKELYPTFLILEEIQIEVKNNKYLYLDFYLPLLKLAVEIDGNQHKEYTPFFHKSEYKKISNQLKLLNRQL